MNTPSSGAQPSTSGAPDNLIQNPLDRDDDDNPNPRHNGPDDSLPLNPRDKPGAGDKLITNPLDKPGASDNLIKNPLDR